MERASCGRSCMMYVPVRTAVPGRPLAFFSFFFFFFPEGASERADGDGDAADPIFCFRFT